MKLKCQPEDFRVTEEILLRPQGGPFSLYRLTKTGIGTPEAIDHILARWNLPRQQVAYAGLKDRHAQTTQFLTIHRGPRQRLKTRHFDLEPQGQCVRPIHAKDIVANHFGVVLRDMSATEVTQTSQAADQVVITGIPNYFDEQRFGSVGKSGEFIAKPWCLGDYERALWLAMADDNDHDRPDEREQKRILREHWGRWPECKAALTKSHRRSVITLLADRPGDFKRALSIIRQDLRSIYLAAFQSDLWNRWLAKVLQATLAADQLTWQMIGPRRLPFPTSNATTAKPDSPTPWRLDRHLVLPLPSSRLHMSPSPLLDLLGAVMAEEGMELRQVRLKFPRDTFFSKGERPALLVPRDLRYAIAADELYPGKQKVTLEFALPRGAYATMLVKRITGLEDFSAREEADDESPTTSPEAAD